TQLAPLPGVLPPKHLLQIGPEPITGSSFRQPRLPDLTSPPGPAWPRRPPRVGGGSLPALASPPGAAWPRRPPRMRGGTLPELASPPGAAWPRRPPRMRRGTLPDLASPPDSPHGGE